MKILIIRLGRIGDMILSTPLLHQLKRGIPNSSVDVLASLDNHRILDFADYVDNVFIWDKSPLKLISLIIKLRKRNYNLILEPKDHYSTESYYIAGLVKADKRIGFVKGESSIFDVDISNCYKDKTHFQDRILSTLKALELTPDYNLNIPLMYPNYKEDKEKIREKYFVVNISASKESKNIPFETAKHILNQLKSKNIRTLLMASPKDDEIAEKLANITQTERAITKSIIDTFPIIHLAKGLISADTSLVHIAGTYNTPVMVLSKSIEKELLKFSPKSNINIVIKSNSQERIDINQTDINDEIERFLNLTEEV